MLFTGSVLHQKPILNFQAGSSLGPENLTDAWIKEARNSFE